MARDYLCQCGHTKAAHTGEDRKFMGRECTETTRAIINRRRKPIELKCICTTYRTTATPIEESLDRIEEILKSIGWKLATQNERTEQ